MLPEPQKLTLFPHEDEKKWVAEITGDDPTFKLKRTFLPEIAPNTYDIYDGYYQIHGIHPGITPFAKEYCVVEQGHMQRHLTLPQVLRQVEAIKAKEPERVERIKAQLIQQFDDIDAAVDHELVHEDLLFQKEQLDMMDDFDQLAQAYQQLLRQKKTMIQRYRDQVATLPDDYQGDIG